MWPAAALGRVPPVTLHYSPTIAPIPPTSRSRQLYSARPNRCANGTLDFRAATKRKNPVPNQQHPPGIAIPRDVTGRLALFINGQRSDRRGQGQLALLACLLDNLGRAIPYRRLVTVIGRKSDNWSTRHLLRQYMLVLREILLANKAPFVIATVQDVGYALCEIAENPRRW